MAAFIIKTIASVEKILKYTAPKMEETRGVCFENARYNFQLATWSEERLRGCKVEVEGTLAPFVRLRIAEDVAVKFTYNFDIHGDDDFVLGQKAGLYPDLLREYESFDLSYFPDQWTSIWVTVTGGEKPLPAGEHTLTFTVKNESGELAKTQYTLTVIAEKLPPLDLFNTNWVHYDCIAEWYRMEVFSKEYYPVMNAYLKNALDHGVNTLLTPLFTPPLDTKVGEERLTVQLVGVERKNGKYTFDFTQLDEFLNNAFSLGFERIEFSHLFTQWGGLYCPKIMATTERGYEKIFGWETESEGEEYVAFLNAFLPALMRYVEEKGIFEQCYLHLTDEPQKKDLEKYSALRRIVKAHAKGMPVIDALSEYEFVEHVDIPVVDISCVKHFVGKCEAFGAYYFCGTSKNAANRFIVHPALRTRLLGYQAYRHKFTGFLHWGFNFWKTEHSVKNIDPYLVNDAGGAFPAGDPFTVYPGENAPVDSVRNEIVSDGWQDYRELLFVERRVGREAILRLFDKYKLFTINDYSLEEQDYVALRKEILSLAGIEV